MAENFGDTFYRSTEVPELLIEEAKKNIAKFLGSALDIIDKAKLEADHFGLESRAYRKACIEYNTRLS